MRGETNITALDEIMAGKGIVLIGGHQAQSIAGTDQVLIMDDLAVLFIMVHHMTDTGVHNMEGIAAGLLSEGLELESVLYLGELVLL